MRSADPSVRPEDVRQAHRTLTGSTLRTLSGMTISWFGSALPILLLAWHTADHGRLLAWAAATTLSGWITAVASWAAGRRSGTDRVSRLQWAAAVGLALMGATLAVTPMALRQLGNTGTAYLAEAWVVAAATVVVLFSSLPLNLFLAMMVPTYAINAVIIGLDLTDAPVGFWPLPLAYLGCLIFGQYRQHRQTLTVLVGELTGRRLVTEVREANEKLQHRATHDPLTGLFARDAFLDAAQAALDAAPHGRVALLIIDVDRFKTVNDSMGHAAGDRLLVGIADRLRRCLRDGDLAARHGGDEFTALLGDVSGDADARRTADRIRAAMAKPFVIDDQRVTSTVSIGLAINADPQDRAADLLRHADAALYRVKDAGRNGVEIFDQALRDSLLKRVSDETELRDALAAGQIVAWFQPIVDMRDGAVVGAEALARWQHPEHGILGPDRFLPLLEDAGMLPALGREIADQVFAFRRDVGTLVPAPFRITVNIGVRDQAVATIVTRLIEQARQAGVAPTGIALEITENAVIGDLPGASRALDQARRHGFSVMLDDFGTGYSSLALLRDLHLDALKIDRSFVRGMAHRVADAAIVPVVLDLARRLDLYVVAEGVADEDDVERLLADGAVYAQGFHYSPAVPPHEFLRMLHGGVPWVEPGAAVPAVRWPEGVGVPEPGSAV